ncbi:MAG: hypothetical protein ACD_49C00009G0058 [uncultured bacterium (gcode 4)]|uniref:FecR protein domain-containing protein n=1 Tax=uncultured bacterium (gcode 4) TaxID=1234023 RepID=K2BDG6_9BACT|nr:MAG: hypothetical protein ACD_49C00009G0058 [uncultured bacterium (gcode 4)]
MARMRNGGVQTNNYSSFILPIIIAIGIIILIVKLIFWGSNNTVNRTWNYINVEPSLENSKIYIYMSGDSKKEIDGSTKMFSTDNKVQIESGEAKISFPDNDSISYLDKRWELQYEWLSNSKQVFSLLNSDFWTEVNTGLIQVKLKNFTVDPEASSVLAFSQNAIASNVFVLKWTAKITLNIASDKEKSVSLGVGQKITILNNDLKDEALKLDDKVVPIDVLFKEEDFFVRHNWLNYLEWSWSWSLSWSGLAGSGSTLLKNQKYISFIYPTDEATVDWPLVDIEWTIMSVDVEKITLNDKEVSINKWENKFSFKWFNLWNSVNNVVYKAYDIDNNLLTKWVIIIYSNWWDVKKEEEKPTVTSYPISDKDFRIIEPAGNPYKTTENVVKIVWQVNKWVVKYISINWFRLTKFPQFSSTWYYFANKDYGTMNDGINLYTIKYYWTNDELLSTNLFTIVKEAPEVTPAPTVTPVIPTPTPEKTSSWSTNNNS